MNINKVLTNNPIAKVSNNNVKTNHHLLNEKVEDTLSIHRAEFGEAIDYISTLTDKDNNRRFDKNDLDLFKLAYMAGEIELEPIKKFATKTKLPMEDFIQITSFNKDAKDSKFYDKLDAKIDELNSQNVSVKRFRQNVFVPDNEFSLTEVDNNNNKGRIVSYNTELIPVAERKNTYIDKADKNKIKSTIENKKDGSTHTVIYNKKRVENSSITRRDKAGNVVREEISTKSPVKGIVNVEYKYPDGRVETVSKGSVDEKTGIVTVKKDMKSFDNTRTEFLYENDPQGNRLIDYKITDKNGKVIMKNSQTFEVLSENKFKSSNNNDDYEITVGPKEITVKDVRRDLEAKLNFSKKCRGNKEELINLLKKVSGNELFETIDSLRKIKGLPKEKTLESYYDPLFKEMNIGDDLFAFLHELGHAKDGAVGHDEMFKNNPQIRKAWKEERARFNENSTDIERQMIDYFIQAKGHYQGEYGGLSETIAECNALTSAIHSDASSLLGERTQVLQQHFPKTIAAIKEAMNYKNDIFAIEYYGT